MIDKMYKEQLQKVSFEDIKGWAHDNHLDAFKTLKRGDPASLLDLKIFNRNSARKYFEENYQPYKILNKFNEETLYTGYFEPILHASTSKTEVYNKPLYGFPIKNVKKILDLSRKEIEEDVLWDLPILAWISNTIDLYFMHIQGSGTLKFENGTERRFVFDGKNNYEYTSVGRYLTDNKFINKNQISMQSIKKWMNSHPENIAIKYINKSFIFFKEDVINESNRSPLGQLGIRLTPLRSLAVDMSIYSINTPIWINTIIPIKGLGKFERFERLMLAQDKGSAIKGLFRGDIFFGNDEKAGYMKSGGDIIIFNKL